MIRKEEFYDRIKKRLRKTILSKTGTASYSAFHLEGKMLNFKRDNTDKCWKIDVDELYSIYQKNGFIDTSVIKATINRRVNSPSVAVLMAIDCITKDGIRI